MFDVFHSVLAWTTANPALAVAAALALAAACFVADRVGRRI
jgi:hypothetical protein